MTHFNLRILLYVCLLLAGCSAPPKPTAIEWDNPLAAINHTLPIWQENSLVTRSPVASGHWSRIIANFQGNSQEWTPDIWYAIAHSTHIAVTAPDATAFFAAKTWLRQQGATALIAYRPKTHCLICNTTDIYLCR
ncbi:cag pathogenicity island Cag12 family protein [Citrobacter sp. JGM124]|uniref:cag pathogenicity island Cag12 family protein n=1 Tax=Citrobacter sp. JGM124 TaxID=2799789 RepID=UPI001BA7CA5A|nr:cag pathogenicity island Cag12 family protein [Citrobacter sp. JGM124]MBS0847034.1 hypothetical protein [Citrobacter sp. JGM124]